MSEETRAEADAGPVTRRRSRRRVPFQPRQILMLAIIWLARVAGRPATVKDAHRRLHVYEVVEFIGRWSMIDVFVVAILSALVQLGFVASIHPGPAAVSFALSVAFTMLSAQSFDPRLIWRGLPLRSYRK